METNSNEIKPLISFDDLMKLDIRMGKVMAIFSVAKSEFLHRMKVDFGEDIGIKDIITNVIGKCEVKHEDLQDKLFPFIINLPEAKMRGEISQGMIIGFSNPITPNVFNTLSNPNFKESDIGSIVI